MYVCGLTVQNYSHLGHIRSAVNYDVIRRYLEYKGYMVEYIQNFTDINEKILNRAKEEGLSPEDLAEKYTRSYLEDISNLNIKEAIHYPRATKNIDIIVEMIEELVKKGYAYEKNGNVYFSVDNYTDYGKLSGRNPDEMKAGARLDIVDEKENPLDFALWKKAPEGAKNWDSPWGKGWPGWHIECSAMALKYLGKKIDIHGGGSDLIFPHHENEIAQSESCSGDKPFARYWLHNGPVNLKGEKMSKSLGNFFTTREVLKDYTPEELRYYILEKHYRSPINFSRDEMEQSRKGLQRLVNTANNLKKLITEYTKKGIESASKKDKTIEDKELQILNINKKEFGEAMDDDFNSAQAIAVLQKMSRELNSFMNSPDFSLNETSYQVLKKAYNLYKKLSEVLGFVYKTRGIETKQGELSALIKIIMDVREKARREKNWALADQIRDRLQELGYIIKDTPRGPAWERDSDKIAD